MNNGERVVARRTHNNLRISRILLCLGIFGFRHLQSPLIEFFLNEIVAEKTLYNCRHSCFKFWMTTLDDVARRHVDDYARQLESRRWTSSPTSPGDDVQSAGQRLNGRTGPSTHIKHIIYPFTRGTSYSNILFVSELSSLESRRDQLSRSFFQDITHPSSSLYHLLPPPRDTSVLSRLRTATRFAPKILLLY